MIAVILAAGMGTRLRPMTEAMPKGLIEIEGKPLLEYSLENLNKCGISEVILVVGFLEGMIRQKFGDCYCGMRIRYIKNALFSETGSMVSLSEARALLKDDILLLESDLFYDAKAIHCLLQSEQRNAILTADVLNNGDDVFICVNGQQQVVNLGKNIREDLKNSIAGCLVGISRFSSDFLKHLFETAEENYRSGWMNRHYEECVLEASLKHLPVYAVHCSELAWTEIDNETDLNTARKIIYPRIFKKGMGEV